MHAGVLDAPTRHRPAALDAARAAFTGSGPDVMRTLPAPELAIGTVPIWHLAPHHCCQEPALGFCQASSVERRVLLRFASSSRAVCALWFVRVCFGGMGRTDRECMSECVSKGFHRRKLG